MGLLDANVPQMVTSQASFSDQASLFTSTVHSAEQSALSSQAAHQGESAQAFQVAHGRFVEVATKMNQLLAIAGQNIGDGANTYTMYDGQGATGYNSALGALPSYNV